MARSVGDYAVKAVGVTAEPEVTPLQLSLKYDPFASFIVVVANMTPLTQSDHQHTCLLYLGHYVHHGRFVSIIDHG